MNDDTPPLEEHKNNIFNALIGDSLQKKTDNDSNPDKNENEHEEKAEETINNVETTDSDKNNKEVNQNEIGKEKEKIMNEENNKNTDIKSVDNDLNQNPLNQSIDNLNSINPEQTKDQIEENKSQNNKPDDKIETKMNGEINPSQTNNSSRSQDSSQSSSYYTERSTDLNNSRNTKTQRNNQPPQLQGKLPQIVFHSPDSLTYKALTLQPLPPMNRQTRSSVVLDLSTYIDQCSQEGLIAEANFILEVSESVKKIQTPRKIEMQQLQLKDNLDNCNNEIEAQNA